MIVEIWQVAKGMIVLYFLIVFYIYKAPGFHVEEDPFGKEIDRTSAVASQEYDDFLEMLRCKIDY